MPTGHQRSVDLGERSVASPNASMEWSNCAFCNMRVQVLYSLHIVNWHKGKESSLLVLLMRLLLRHHSWVA